MPFRFNELEIQGVLLIEPRVFPDDRGAFWETYKYSDFVANGITESFVQGNHSLSTRGVLRGLHYQKQPKAQGKLVRVVMGEAIDVAVDMRRGSPTYGRWIQEVLSSENKRMLYVPPWCSHGFYVLSEEAQIVYMVTQEYAPECEAGIIWNDPDLGIQWPEENPNLSPKDSMWPRFRDADIDFQYGQRVEKRA